MIDTTTAFVADLLASASAASPGVVHPRFESVMSHVALEGNAFLLAARRDHAPLTDLRLRRDLSSRAMFELNVDALIAQQPELRRTLTDHLDRASSANETSVALRETLGLGSISRRTRSVPFQSEAAAYVALLKYVNAFGSWEDALDVARSVHARRKAGAESQRETLTYALAASVLGLCRESAASDDLFAIALAGMPDPIERTFAGLRWASLRAKRQGNIDAAEDLIDALDSDLAHASAHRDDKSVGFGMLWNLRALLAVRRRDPKAAHAAVTRAIAHFEQGNGHRTAAHAIGSEEARRYEWMARLNLIQFDIFAHTFVSAIEKLTTLVDFSRENDPGSLHTSLSTPAYVHIQNDDPAAALSPLLESHERLRAEYDPFVIDQVRKMLIRCYIELGREKDAERVSALPAHFWLSTEMPGA